MEGRVSFRIGRSDDGFMLMSFGYLYLLLYSLFTHAFKLFLLNGYNATDNPSSDITEA